MSTENRRLWLIDAGYLYRAQTSIRRGYQFDYKKLRELIERDGELWRAYYLNATPNAPTDAQDAFHTWLQSAPPDGPKIITKLYQLRRTTVDRAYCRDCGRMVDLACPYDDGSGTPHALHREQQKGVDAGLVTLALTLHEEYDTLVLSSGDGDLLEVIDYLSRQRRRIELVVFRTGVSTDLQSRADSILWLNDHLDELARA